MNRIALAAVALLTLIGAIAGASGRPAAVAPFFTQLPPPGAPFVPNGTLVTATWYCPGTPARGGEGGDREGGQVVIANPTDSEVTGRVRILSVDQPVVTQAVTVAPHGRFTIDVDEVVTSDYASAVVELDGGRGIVEQQAITPNGNVVAPCANATSSNFYFADGSTAEGSTYRLVLTNPFPQAAIADVRVGSDTGERNPIGLQGVPVAANSVVSVNLADHGLQNERLLSVTVQVTSGRLIAAKEQTFAAASQRFGYVLALGAPSLSDQWWFADGEKGSGIREEYIVYNPGERSVTVDLVFLGIPSAEVVDQSALTTTLDVAAGQATSFIASNVTALPAGRHAVVVSTPETASQIVVERVLTRPVPDTQQFTSTVVLGAPSNYRARTWHIPIGVSFPIDQALVIYNTSVQDTNVSVLQVGPGGAVAVPGLESVPLAANGVVAIDLVDQAAVGRELIVQASTQVVVERRLARGDATVRGRSGSLAIPQFT